MRKRIQHRGFTLVELMCVVAIIGVLAALSSFGVRKYLSNAKSAEAQIIIGQMAKHAVTAYQRENMVGDVLVLTTGAGLSNTICGDATTKVPDVPDKIAGGKYQSSPTEWATGNQFNGWTCLRFSIDRPQYFMYGFQGSGSGAVGDTFTATAEGDLNGDGTLSMYAMDGKIQKDSDGVVLTLAPGIFVTDGDE